ncbi:MAG TPA: 4-hydroxy-tetrahydrodipicolinate reductase [Puia sp.]|nr:4-hydroxy-tetrahydrodipicolinate reductase [Puia sp.]
MRIALVGYGKMGKTIEEVAIQKGHEVVLKIDIDNRKELDAAHLAGADAAIEFTGPQSAFGNVMACLEAGIPVVCGSTGWLDRYEEARKYCESVHGTLLYASNFSIGVNIFFELNKKLAQLMSTHADYDISMTEIHHTQKKDAPSGTAISLAEQILESIARKKLWVNHISDNTDELEIISERIDPAPGTHKVKYSSAIDDIEIIHTAHSRKGFAAGAVLAAEFISNKKGVLGMKDVLGF